MEEKSDRLKDIKMKEGASDKEEGGQPTRSAAEL